MLAIRMQRTGRSGHAQFRVIVQDSRFSPTRGRVVSYLGSYNPHTKTAAIDSKKAAQYLQNGARPSDTVARLFKKEGIKLPAWVKLDEPRKRDVRNPDKRRSTAPVAPEAPAEAVTEAPEQDTVSTDEAPQEESPAAEAPAEQTADAPAGTEPEPEAPANPAVEEPVSKDVASPENTDEQPTEES